MKTLDFVELSEIMTLTVVEGRNQPCDKYGMSGGARVDILYFRRCLCYFQISLNFDR